MSPVDPIGASLAKKSKTKALAIKSNNYAAVVGCTFGRSNGNVVAPLHHGSRSAVGLILSGRGNGAGPTLRQCQQWDDDCGYLHMDGSSEFDSSQSIVDEATQALLVGSRWLEQKMNSL